MTPPRRSSIHARSIAAAIAVCTIGMLVVEPQTAHTAEPGRAKPQAVASAPSDESGAERGRYLAQIGGCHDCHTPGYAQSAGDVPPDRWLIGSSIGFKGPWGVSYPTNLRLTVQSLSEEQWLAHARAPRLPPMPWFVLRDMTDADVRALYRFFRALGPAGVRAPLPLSPAQPIHTHFIDFSPQPPQAAAKQ